MFRYAHRKAQRFFLRCQYETFWQAVIYLYQVIQFVTFLSTRSPFQPLSLKSQRITIVLHIGFHYFLGFERCLLDYKQMEFSAYCGLRGVGPKLVPIVRWKIITWIKPIVVSGCNSMKTNPGTQQLREPGNPRVVAEKWIFRHGFPFALLRTWEFRCEIPHAR